MDIFTAILNYDFDFLIIYTYGSYFATNLQRRVEKSTVCEQADTGRLMFNS